MLFKASLYLTVILLVFLRVYRVGGTINLSAWELSLIFCAFFWLYEIAINKKINIKFDSLNLAIIAFLLVNIFSSIRMPEYAGRFMKGGMWYNLRTIEPVLLYVIVTDFLSDRKNIKPFLTCLFAVLCFESILAISQSLFDVGWPGTAADWYPGADEWYPRETSRGYFYYLTGIGSPMVINAFGTFGHFMELAPYLSCFIPLLVALVVSGDFFSRKATLPLLILATLALFLTYSRGALLGIAVGLLLMFLVQNRPRRIKSFIIILAFSSLAVFLSYTFMSRDYVADSLSLSFRLDIWKKTLGVILSDPWKFFLGTGSGTQLYWTRFEAQGHYFSAHNAYLTIWLETGIFGLLSFIGLFYVLFSKSLKTITHNENKAYRSIIFAMLGIVPVWLIQCGFSSIFLDHASRAFILVLIALGATALCAESSALESPEYSLNIQLANNPYR